ncbi:cyclin-dependent kinase inhibitor [Musa troglodytarum]|uniref:Cyclin-dependent kinase inhibitor n=1 Tax=Musa troglodytarum TaxID=320322 RepID=A0A9E7ERE0_9LILI|nr:cyclin-dependent kinase inhibitor [Musa troglodytarum]
MKCLCSDDQLRVDELVQSSGSLATKDCLAGHYSCRNREVERRVDTGNIEQAESSLRESLCLNDEEARALLGRIEYQRGNVEAAIHVFDGIDLSSVAPKIKAAIAERMEHHKCHSNWDAQPMSIHAVSLLVEAVYLKARALQDLGRFKEAAQSCGIFLNSIESALHDDLPGNFITDNKLQEIVCKAVELLPELWKLAGFPHEAISSYRRALLGHWNLDDVTMAKIQKEFAVFLLYGGCDASPPNVHSQMDGAFIPRNNMEEAVLLLIILLRKVSLKRIEWDSSIIDHLSFALSICGQLSSLAGQVEGLLPGVLEDPNCVKALVLACKVCCENTSCAEEAQARSSSSDSERVSRQSEALKVLEKTERMIHGKDYKTIFNLSLEHAEQRKLDAALRYAKQLLKLEAGSNVDAWILLARILTAQKRFVDAETIINAALEQTGKWDQGELLQTKAKIQIAKGQLKNAIETYTHLLAIIQLRTKSFNYGLMSLKGGKSDRSLEIQTWHDLANVYISMSLWREAEICLSNLKDICPYSALRWHATGQLYEAKGLPQEALGAYAKALDIEPAHVPSLVSRAIVLRHLGDWSLDVIRSLLTDALRLDRTNHIAWFNLGLIYKAEGARSALEAAECFQTAAFLKETAPVEPFR